MTKTISKEADSSPSVSSPKAKRNEVPYPPHLLIAPPKYKPGVKRVNVDRFHKQEFHDREVEKIWKSAGYTPSQDDPFMTSLSVRIAFHTLANAGAAGLDRSSKGKRPESRQPRCEWAVVESELKGRVGRLKKSQG